jgi:hypothetical protein
LVRTDRRVNRGRRRASRGFSATGRARCPKGLAWYNRELVRFDPDDAIAPLRIWDRIDDDLAERDPKDTLDAYFCVRSDPMFGPWLYLSRDPQGLDPYLTPEEARQRENEARQKAEARVRALEAEIARRR